MKNFTPADYQESLDQKKFLTPINECTGDEVPLDVVFVGGGPAGLSGAIHLARLIQKANESGESLGDVQIGVLEKAANLGGHSLSGAVLNPTSLFELFPELKKEDFPLRTQVTEDRVFMVTESGQWRIPTPPTMHNQGNYVVSLCELVRFLGQKAEGLGINIFSSFPADSLLIEGDVVRGVSTTPAGLGRDSQPGSQYLPSNKVTAKITVLTDGTRSPLAQAYTSWQKISSEQPQIYALGVKEIWKVKKAPTYVTHTLGFPLPKSAFGGSWMYPMADDMVSFGLVLGLDYKEANLDTHKLLQKLKNHSMFADVLRGGEIVEWGAKTIPEGGWKSLPRRLHGNGLLMAGDCAGMVNVPALKGIHYAMKAGMLAAESIFEALKNKNFSATELSSYDRKVNSSFIKSELYPVRNMRQAFKSGFYLGGIQAGLMTLTKGFFPSLCSITEEDSKDSKNVMASDDLMNLPEKSEIKSLSKVDAVYLSGNKTRDDIPSHLTVGKDIPPEVARMYASLCPAGVYELQGDKLVVNAPNCVDCKATDILGPRWQPREGGAGPDYKLM